jgi:2-keto-4-pentenoate hydratase/2-oxohepta-3-ene-1,7-dioic acid hydratase in catechol pathway
MADFRLLNYTLISDEASKHAATPESVRPGILVGEHHVLDLQLALPNCPWATSTLAVLNAWDVALPALHELATQTEHAKLTLGQITLQAPLMYPPAIYCTGANYSAHAQEMSAEGKGVDKSVTQPYLFLKSGPHCVLGPADSIALPSVSNSVDWEGEFAVVIGKTARNVSVQDAMKYVAGYTIMNDLSARDLSRRPDWPRWNIDWFGHKNFDGAAPMGPWITPADQIADHTQCHLRLWVNEEKKQDTLVADLIFNVPELIEYLSRRMTLRPGDVIATGTPAGVGRPKGTFLKPGDTVRIEISGLGVLQNPVIQGQ